MAIEHRTHREAKAEVADNEARGIDSWIKPTRDYQMNVVYVVVRGPSRGGSRRRGASEAIEN